MGSTANRRHTRSRELRAALLGAALILVATVAVFTKSNPFSRPYEIRGVFSTTAQLRPGSDVRIGGQRIGKVSAITRGPTPRTSLVTMQIDDREPAIRSDAELSLQPRLVLEGNAFIRVEPGTPTAPELERDATIPLRQTSVAVQLDQAISMFDAPTRAALRDVTREFAGGLGSQPASPRAPRPGYQELRGAVHELDRSLGTFAVAARATRGEKPGDLRAAGHGASDVTAQLAEDPAALGGIIDRYARVSRSLAERDQALQATLRGFAHTFAVAPAQLRAIDAGLPELTRFARVLDPALRAAPAALRALSGAARQIRLIARDPELPRLLTRLRPVTSNLPVLERRLRSVLPQVTAIGRCLTTTVVPALNGKIDDGHLSTGRPVWQEALHMAASLAGAASGFDANGGTLRLGVTESEQAIGINTGSGPLGMLSGLAPDGDVGINPTWLGYGVYPATRPDQPCAKQKLPDYQARRRPGMPRAFKGLGRVTPRAASAATVRPLLKQLTDRKLLLRQALEAEDG